MSIQPGVYNSVYMGFGSQLSEVSMNDSLFKINDKCLFSKKADNYIFIKPIISK